MNRLNFFFIMALGLIIGLAGCIKDKPDEPPASSIPFDPDKVLTIGQIKNIYSDSTKYVFDENYSVFGTVVMDETSGNIYQSAYIQDQTGGIQVNMLSTSGLFLGDSVRILLNGATIDVYGDRVQIQNVDAGRSIEKIKTNHFIQPIKVTLEQLNSNIAYYSGRVIQLDSVEFTEESLGSTFADSANKVDVSLEIQDCFRNRIEVRTSGYANFANRKVPEGNGQLIAIAGFYTQTNQLTIRSYNEIHMNGTRCNETIELPEPNTSIPELKNLYQGQRLQITGDVVIGAHVVANDESGNYYKTLVIQDDQGGIELKINDYDLYLQFPVGQEIFVKCKDLYLDNYGGVIQLGSVYDDNGTIAFGGIQPSSLYKYVFVGNNIIDPEPEDLEISQINTAKLGMLVRLTDVQFAETELGKTWADAANQTSQNRILEDCIGLNIIVRTSGYASFAGEALPEGNGALTAIVSAFNGDYQLYVRDLSDVDLSGDRCEIGQNADTIYSANFNNDWDNWVTVSAIGSQQWDRDNSNGPGNSPCAEINGFEGGYHINKDWLISPEIQLTGYLGVYLSFESAKNYDGDDILIKATDSYTGDPSTTNWVTLTGDLSQGGFIWTGSGSIDISSFAGNAVRVAFEYNSSNSDGAAWRIDNVVIKAN